MSMAKLTNEMDSKDARANPYVQGLSPKAGGKRDPLSTAAVIMALELPTVNSLLVALVLVLWQGERASGALEGQGRSLPLLPQNP